jgi:hypothetical protein
MTKDDIKTRLGLVLLVLYETHLLQALAKSEQTLYVAVWRRGVEKTDHWHRRGLPVRCSRPRNPSTRFDRGQEQGAASLLPFRFYA